MTSFNCWRRLARVCALALVCALLMAAYSPCLQAQNNAVLTVHPVERLRVKRGEGVSQKMTAELRAGFHVNSNAPADEYLIPLRLTWSKGPLEVEQVVYPKPQMEKYDFSPQPVSVFSGTFDILTRFRVASNASPGPALMSGKLRYQACNNKECLPPRNLDITVPVDIQ